MGGFVGGDFVVPAAQVLNECVPCCQGLSGPEAFQSAHRTEPGFQPAWSASTGLLAYRSTTCSAAGTCSSSTRG